MLKKITLTLTTSAAALLLAAAPALVGAESPPPEQHQHQQMQGHMQGDDMHAMHEEGSKMDCQQMHAKMKEMHAKQQEMQAKLDELVKKVKTSSGTTQQEAMADLLTKMVEQRKAMHGMMDTMQPMMMQHMMGHMSSGEMAGMSDCPMMKSGMSKTGMADCPMMKKGSGDSKDDDHAAHH